MTERRLKANTEVFFGAPAIEPPTELIQAVQVGIEPFADVLAFYLFQLATRQESNLVVGIELVDASRESIVMPAIAASIGAHRPQGLAIDVLHLSGGLLGGVAGHVPRHARPPD